MSNSGFLSLLPERSTDPFRVDQIADYLRSTKLTLAELGVGPVHDSTNIFEAVRWKILRRCVVEGMPEDALVVLRAMVVHLTDQPFHDCAPVMKDVFHRSWRFKAIETIPEFFRRIRDKGETRNFAFEHNAVDAFQVFAYSGSGRDFTREDVNATIQALRDIGSTPHIHPLNLTACVHQAARCHGPGGLSAFVDAFPSVIGRRDYSGATPLHNAAMHSNPGNLRVLLSAGVEPRPVDHSGDTPLIVAAGQQFYEGVMVLLETGAYTDQDVDRMADKLARFGPSNEEKIGQLRAFHSAVKARNAIGEKLPGDVGSLKPL